ncbi:dihydrodipicolinate synthase [Histoplasma capsulatum G186AR]|uniref:Dihydrodipicolinate synthase n=1 Tax=Ajellomyces capsulatus TaxID=5037 RepID=A0A8H7YBA3_AJECA|nr:dihydrodipicolinate synthase [Histoplasma capsulatum]QSS70338.1 dihydrodipicolinate synthase [Histoplasma capsulatum G186AR]
MTFTPFYYLLNAFLTLQSCVMISTICHGLETIHRAFSFGCWIFVLQCHSCFSSSTRFSFLFSPLFSNLPTLLFRFKLLILPIAYLIRSSK